jgi:hypothetical protein
MAEQTFEGWCVYDGFGRPVFRAIEEIELYAKKQYLGYAEDWEQKWAMFEKQGFTVRRVTVTVREQHGIHTGDSDG